MKGINKLKNIKSNKNNNLQPKYKTKKNIHKLFIDVIR